MINLAAIASLSNVDKNGYGTVISLQEGDTIDYGSIEAQILIILNETGLLLTTFTLQEMIDTLSSTEIRQGLTEIISDNRDQGLSDQPSDENNQSGEQYIENGAYEITANNAERLLEDPRNESIHFLKKYALLWNGNCWVKYNS